MLVISNRAQEDKESNRQVAPGQKARTSSGYIFCDATT